MEIQKDTESTTDRRAYTIDKNFTAYGEIDPETILMDVYPLMIFTGGETS